VYSELDLARIGRTTFIQVDLKSQQFRPVDKFINKRLEIRRIISSIASSIYLKIICSNLTVVFPLYIEITSFINIRNKIGPETEPCGTSLLTSLTEENGF